MVDSDFRWRHRLEEAYQRRSELEDLMTDSSAYCFKYPWNGLQERLAELGQDRLNMIGYGSLLNPDSAKRTIRDTPWDGHPPVLAFGAIRLFNYVMPQTVIERYSEGKRYSSSSCAALNTKYTGRVGDALNGRVISTGFDDLDALREREKGYDLTPVAYVPWGREGSKPNLGFVLCATEEPWEGTVYVSDSIAPFPPYVKVCRNGAQIVDEEFYECFLDTTFLADGLTHLRDWSEEESD